jgi:DNA polymerase-3 subunit epsilon/CBS domain-containing protein
MVEVLGNVPLFALDAVAIDLETTGLDPKDARIVEIGAVRLSQGQIGDESFEALVQGGARLTPEVERLTGISNAELVGKPAFGEVYPGFVDFCGERVLIGHSIGFDLAMLRRECDLAGLRWVSPRVLDTRLLGALAAPRLADHTLEALSGWLGIPLDQRHRARGDAVSAARIFHGLLPKLREAGIRTLGEAEQACRGLTSELERYHRAGWVEPVASPAQRDAERTLARLDSYPYRHRVREVMSAPPIVVPLTSTLREAMRVMAEKRASSVFVGREGESGDWGILTERDVLRAIARDDVDALQKPAEALASKPLATVPADAFVYRAIGRMSRMNIRHLAATGENGAIVGALSSRDLLRLRATLAIALGDDIDQARDAATLGKAWAKLPAMANALVEEGIAAREVAAIIAREIGALTRRAAEFAVAQMAAEGMGAPPRDYSVLILGSAGRGESLLSMDQDNALVYAGEDDEAVDAFFAELGRRFTHILHEVGVPLCKGGVMASNAAFRASLAGWKARIANWVSRANPQDLLNVDIVFDLRPVHGNGALGAELSRFAAEAAEGQVGFLKLLVETHENDAGPLTLFGGFRLEEGRIDLKRHALGKIVAAARVMALALGSRARSTADRLGEIRAAGKGGDSDLSRLDEAHQRVMDLILRAQLADIRAGRQPTTRVPADLMDSQERSALKSDFSTLSSIDTFVRDWMSAAMQQR